MPRPDNLSEREYRFVQAYIGEAQGNATEAARIAGYADARHRGKKSLSQSALAKAGSRLLDRQFVRDAIAKARFELSAGSIATAKERQEFLTAIIRDDYGDTKDRLKACEILGRMQGDFVERRITENITRMPDGRKVSELSDEELRQAVADSAKRAKLRSVG